MTDRTGAQARTEPARVHWLVRQDRRHRSVFYPLIALIIGLHLNDLHAGVVPWLFVLAHFFVYPQLVYWLAARQPSGARQRDVELRCMVLDIALYALWFVALGFPLWICFVVFVAGAMSMVAYHGLPGLVRAAVGLLTGLALGAVLFRPIEWHLATSTVVTLVCMASFFLFALLYARDASVRTRVLNESRKLARAQVDEIRMLQEQLREEALRDPLTGLYNRRHLSETLPGALARCARHGMPLALVMVDIDHFKRVNDRHGHAGGDAMLCALARLLKAQIRASDMACRMGGEEFLLVLENAPLAIAHQRAQALREAFAALAVPHDGELIRATMSCGLASYPEHGRDDRALLRAADHALYAAKNGGRNQVRSAVDAPPEL